MPETPEQLARQTIDTLLGRCGWAIQDKGAANLPAPEVIAREIVDDLEAALEPFATIAEDLKR